MENRREAEQQDDTIDIGRYAAIIRANLWKIVGFSLLVGVATLALLFLKPNIYLASATIAPPKENKKQNPAFGVLSSFGVDVGGATDVEDLEVLFRSDDLTVRVFHKHNLWPIVLPDRFDPKTGMTRTGWVDRIFHGNREKPPGDWDAIKIAKDWLAVRTNKKLGTVSISFESPSPEGSADIVRYYLDEAKSRLQEEAFERASQNKKFIEQQIGKTPDALTRERLYSLFGQEVEREMLARNREQFGFQVIDSPRNPDRKFKPQRSRIAIVAATLSFFFGCAYFIMRDKHRKNGSTPAAENVVGSPPSRI